MCGVEKLFSSHGMGVGKVDSRRPAFRSRGRVNFGVLVAAFVIVLALIFYGTSSWANRPSGVTVDGYELTTPEFQKALSEIKPIIRFTPQRDPIYGVVLTETNPLSKKVRGFYDELEKSDKRFIASGTYGNFLASMPREFDSAEKRKAGREAVNDHFGTILKHNDEQISILTKFLSLLMEVFSLNEVPQMGRMVRAQDLRESAIAVKQSYAALFDFLDRTQPGMKEGEYVFSTSSQKDEFESLSKNVDRTLKAHRLQEGMGLEFVETALIDLIESFESE